MSGAMNQSLHSRINYVHSPDGNRWERPGILKRCTTGRKGVHVLHYANAPVLTRKNHASDLAWKDRCSVLNALQ